MSEDFQKYYRNILNDNGVASIIQNKVSQYANKGLFPKCEQNEIPQFFRSNLVSSNRIIKYVYGEYCVYRAFYFQLFKLMFEIQDQERDYVQILKQIVFDPEIIQRNGENSRAKREMRNSKVRDHSMSEISQQEGFRRQFQMHQKCVAQFMEIVLQNSENFSSFEEYLPFYPQIDTSMSFILQTFIDNAQQNMDSIQSILEYLSELFEIQLVVFENCFKFQQSDVFLFLQQKQNQQVWVYIAYNENEDNEENQEDNNEESQEDNEGKSHLSQSQQQKSRYEHENGSQVHSNQQYSNQSSLISRSQINPQNNNPSQINYDALDPSQINQDAINVSVNKNQRASSYHDNVITSESKPQLSNKKIFEQKHTQNFNYQPQNQRQQSQNKFSIENNDFYEIQNSKNTSSFVSSQHSNIHQQRPFDSILHQETSYKVVQNKTNNYDRDFQKKQVHFNQQQYQQYKNGHSQLSKLQSFTQTYQEDQFSKTPEISQQSFIKNGSNYNQYSSNAIENKQNEFPGYRKVTDSKSDTIINMFGDMLGSTANIGSIQHSQKMISGVFGSAKNISKEEPQRDNDGYYRSITKNKTDYFGSFNHQNEDTGRTLQGNLVNMKKIKFQRQVILQTKPSNSYAFDQDNNINLGERKDKNNERSSFEQRRRIQQIENNQPLIDSEQLRQDNRVQRIDSYRQKASSFNVKKSGISSSNQGDDYLDNIQARSYNGNQNAINMSPVKFSSFNNNNDNLSSNSRQANMQAPDIKINSVRSQSQTSSIQMNNRNNYYREDDQVNYQNRPKQYSNHQPKQSSQEREFSIKSQEHNPNISNQHKYTQNKANQLFQHQYKSQQYVTISNSHQINIPKPPTKAYTYNQQSNKTNKIPQTQNTEEEDDFFFHPNKQSLKYGLKTIKQVRASKQTNKQSYIIPENQNNSKISQQNSKITENDKKAYQIDSKVSQRSSKISHQSSKESQQIPNYAKTSQNYPQIYQQKYSNKNNEKLNQIQTVQIQSSKYLSKVFNSKVYQSKKKESKQLADESINNGTYYKQFTNSKVLKLLKEPYRTKVQILRNRFKGEHRTSINKIIS